MRKALIIASIMASLSSTAPAARAPGSILAVGLQSGSQSGTQSGGQNGGQIDSDLFRNLPPRDPAAEAYSSGKSLVSKRIGCKKCARPRGVKDAETARTVATQVRAGEFNLKANERQLVLLYLSKRFGI